MAQALFKVGQKEQAEACLRDGRAEALRRGDDEYVREADRVLRKSVMLPGREKHKNFVEIERNKL